MATEKQNQLLSNSTGVCKPVNSTANAVLTIGTKLLTELSQTATRPGAQNVITMADGNVVHRSTRLYTSAAEQINGDSEKRKISKGKEEAASIVKTIAKVGQGRNGLISAHGTEARKSLGSAADALKEQNIELLESCLVGVLALVGLVPDTGSYLASGTFHRKDVIER